MADEFTIEFYEDDHGRQPVTDWMEHDLSDVELAALLAGLRIVLARQGIAVCGTEWGKQLGGGLCEFRIRHTAEEIAHMFGEDSEEAKKNERVLLRVFFHAHGDKLILLLGGYDKGADPSTKRQEQEIKRARKRLADVRARGSRG